MRRTGSVAQSTRVDGPRGAAGIVEAFELGDDLRSEQQDQRRRLQGQQNDHSRRQ